MTDRRRGSGCSSARTTPARRRGASSGWGPPPRGGAGAARPARGAAAAGGARGPPPAGRVRAGLASAEYGDDGERLALPVVDRYFGGILAPTERRPGWEDAGHPHGTLLLARRACLEEIGLFDERYFAYCEEADLG